MQDPPGELVEYGEDVIVVTVQDLIARLQQYPPTARVMVRDVDGEIDSAYDTTYAVVCERETVYISA